MTITVKEANEMTAKALEKREQEAQARAEDWVDMTCPPYIQAAATAGKYRTKEFKCPSGMSKRVIAILEANGFSVKYRGDFELIQISWG